MAKWEDTKVITRYLHGQEDELSELWDYDAPQQDVYHYSLYEVRIELEVDMPTGESRILTVDGRKLCSES